MAATFQMFTSAKTWERATTRLAYFGNDVCVREASRVAKTWAGCYACGHVEEREPSGEGEWAACSKCGAPADKHMDSFDSFEAATAGVDLPW